MFKVHDTRLSVSKGSKPNLEGQMRWVTTIGITGKKVVDMQVDWVASLAQSKLQRCVGNGHRGTPKAERMLSV